MTTDLARCIPILASLDIPATIAWYETWLGFKGDAVGDYALLRRDSMELHFWLAPDRIHPEHTACYIRGGQVPALYAEFSARGLPGLTAFEVKPWDMKEFAVIDLHGNLLRFGCAPGEIGG